LLKIRPYGHCVNISYRILPWIIMKVRTMSFMQQLSVKRWACYSRSIKVTYKSSIFKTFLEFFILKHYIRCKGSVWLRSSCLISPVSVYWSSIVNWLHHWVICIPVYILEVFKSSSIHDVIVNVLVLNHEWRLSSFAPTFLDLRFILWRRRSLRYDNRRPLVSITILCGLSPTNRKLFILSSLIWHGHEEALVI